ncbi:protein wings apart-like [Rhizophagus irregularis DAOM 181602=DAOM 197198]|nr:protein wings apart-like [Rhizophagus irregularis DAOM 181602=DAOM 197198]
MGGLLLNYILNIRGTSLIINTNNLQGNFNIFEFLSIVDLECRFVIVKRPQKIRDSTSTTTTTAIQSIPFNDEGYNKHHLVNPSQKVDTTSNWMKSADGLDLDNITSSRLRNRKSSVKGSMSEGSSSGRTSLLGKRPPPKSSSSTEDIAESCSRLSVNDESDLPPPSKRRDVGVKGKVSVIKNQTNNLDVFDFPDDDDSKPIRRFSNKTYTKTHDKFIRGLNNKTSSKNKDDKSTQGFLKKSVQTDKSFLEFNTKNFDGVKGMMKLPDNNLGGDFKMTHGIKKHENHSNIIVTNKISEKKIGNNNIKVTHGIDKISQNNLGGDSETNMVSYNNLNNNVSATLGKNKTNSKSDDVKVTRGTNKTSKNDNKKNVFDFPEFDDGLGEVVKNITKRKSFTMSDSTKKISKNSIDSSRVIDQNSFSSVNISSKVNSSSTRISKFLTTKTSKSTSSTNNCYSDNCKNNSSSDIKPMDVDVFVKFFRGETKTIPSLRSQPMSGSHEPITGIVNDKTNNLLSNDNIRPAKKNSQTITKSATISKESSVSKPPKKLRRNQMLIDIPQAPSRPITEVGTPVSFLSFQQRKKPIESSVWEVVDAVTSPVDILPSPRKQNLVAKMSKPATPAKQDKQDKSQSFSTSNYLIQKQKIVDIKTNNDEIADELLASSESVNLPSSTPPSYNVPNGNGFGGQKTYGRGRTILGQDFDSDPIPVDMEIDDNDVNEDNLTPKKYALKSSHELRETGDYTRFTDEMDDIFDGLESRSITIRINSVKDLSLKLLDGDFLLKVRAHNYISKIYTILNGNQDLLIRCYFSFIICMLMEDKHSSESLIQEHGFIEFVVNLLNTSTDPLNIDTDSLEKNDKINEFKNIILKSSIFTNLSQISLKSIALRTLSSLSSLRTRHESTIKNILRHSGGLLSVISVLKPELELVGGLLSEIENGKLPSLQNATLDFTLIEQCLKILENSTLFCSENQRCIVEDKDLLHMLLELLLYCQVEACGKNVEEASLALECLLGTLRVLINLTNENLPACHTDPFIVNATNSESVDAVKFDVLLLSIGLLINLVETDSNIQDEFRKVDQNPTCPGSRMCMRTCTCPSRESAVSCLVSLYNYQLEKDDDETDSNIVAAYMAVLLGLLIKNNQDNQQLIIDILPLYLDIKIIFYSFIIDLIYFLNLELYVEILGIIKTPMTSKVKVNISSFDFTSYLHNI